MKPQQAGLSEGPLPREGEGVGWQETVAVLWRQRKYHHQRGGDQAWPGPWRLRDFLELRTCMARALEIERISRTEDLSTQGSPSGNWLNLSRLASFRLLRTSAWTLPVQPSVF